MASATGSRSRHSTRAGCRSSAALCRSVQPAAGKSRAQQSPADRRHAAHVSPDEIVAMVRRLEQNRALIDAEVIGGDPAMLRIDRAALDLGVGVAEARIEAVLEPVFVE